MMSTNQFEKSMNKNLYLELYKTQNLGDMLSKHQVINDYLASR